MKNLVTVFLLVGSALLAPAAESPPAPPSASPSSDTAVSAGPTSTRPRPISPTTKARLNAGLPGFTSSAKAEAEATEVNPGNRELDLPLNDIVRLPQYDVRDDKLPTFRAREFLTPKGRADVALKRHPGLRFGPGPLSVLNVRPGLEMLEEEDAIDRRQEMVDLVSFSSSIDRALPQNPATGIRTIRANLGAR